VPQVAQLDRRFSPDLLVISAGSTVSFPNMDPIFHNIFSLSKAKSFDLGSYDQGQNRKVMFPKAGIVDVYCHLHPNMEATIVVTPTAGTRAPTARDSTAFPTFRRANIPSLPGISTPASSANRSLLKPATMPSPISLSLLKRMRTRSPDEPRCPHRENPLTTRFRTRTFLLCFVPFAVLLAGSFWMIQRFVESTVRDGLRVSLRANQVAIANIHAKGDLQNSRFLKVAGENSALKAGIELLLSNPKSAAARRTVEDQLRELGEHMGFDFLLVSAPNGAPLAGVVRQPVQDAHNGSQLLPLDPAQLDHAGKGLLVLDGRTFQVASVAIDQDDGNVGSLSVGEYFNFAELTTPAVLPS